MADPRDKNFFTHELNVYYSEHGITLTREILDVLNKIPLDFSDEEREVFVKFILPRRQQIKQALKKRYIHLGASKEAWRNNLHLYSKTLIGQIASEMMLEEEVHFSEPIPQRVQPTPVRANPSGEVNLADQPEVPSKNNHEVSPVSSMSTSPNFALPNLNMRRNRRRIFHKKRRVGNPIAWGSSLAILLLLLLFVFSPWGPYGHLLFKSHAEQVSGTPRLEKASNVVPPTIAIVVDDVGESTTGLDQWLAIDAPLTFSVKPRCEYSQQLAGQLRQAGYRIMLHVPVENQQPHAYAGEGQITTTMDHNTVFSTLDDDLATVPGAEGIDNHEGEKGCGDLQLMTWQCEWAKSNGLFVVDSRNYGHSVLTPAAISLGLERRYKQVSLDDRNDPAGTRSAILQLADLARQDGVVIGICNFPHSNTPGVMAEMIPELQADGIHFAFVEDIHN
jgi:uncharacterized protein